MKRVTPFVTLAPAQPRRLFLRNGLAGLAALMAEPLISACSSDEADKSGNGSGGTGGNGPALRSNLAAIGPLGPADANGLRLPDGFTSRIVAQNGTPPAPGRPYPWHIFPDGGATYESGDGGFIYVSNSEMIAIDQVAGGVGALRFDPSGEIVDAYPILTGTNTNCAGGKTQWNTWLSCEEIGRGQVFECDVTGQRPGEARPALGIFKHEAVALDPVNQHLYLSEDEPDGRFYRFVPNAKNAQGFADLSAGRLEVAERADDGKVSWHEVPDPQFTGADPTRLQVAESTVFKGGEGLAYSAGVIFLSTKHDNRVWAYDVEAQTMIVLYDQATSTNSHPVRSRQSHGHLLRRRARRRRRRRHASGRYSRRRLAQTAAPGRGPRRLRDHRSRVRSLGKTALFQLTARTRKRDHVRGDGAVSFDALGSRTSGGLTAACGQAGFVAGFLTALAVGAAVWAFRSRVRPAREFEAGSYGDLTEQIREGLEGTRSRCELGRRTRKVKRNGRSFENGGSWVAFRWPTCCAKATPS
jgi:hypothetical protein